MSDKSSNSPFDYIKSIFAGKKLDASMNGYAPFIVNRGLSFYRDCVFQANELNRYANLDSDMQYDFLLATIKPGRRQFQKWIKKETNEHIELVQEYYQCSRTRALQILSIINNDALDDIRRKLFKGGRVL